MLKRALRAAPARTVGARVLGAYLAFALRTTRWTLHGAEHLAPFNAGGPLVVAFWHEFLPLLPALWTLMRRGGARPAVPRVLVSRHGDGRFVGELMTRFGVRPVHGSSSRGRGQRGGSAGVRALLAALAGGDPVLITPDGPRGPRRRAAGGVAQVAALSGAPVLPVAARTSRGRALPSWDRMVLPLPFGRGVVVCGPTLAVPREGWDAALPRIEAALDDAAERAGRLCPA